MALALIELVKLASTTTEHPRLNAKAARQVVTAIAEWLEQQGAEVAYLPNEYTAIAKRLREEIR